MYYYQIPANTVLNELYILALLKV